MIGVILAPTLIIAIWFAAFGTTAGHIQNSGVDLSQYTTELVLFNMFDQLPFSFFLSLLAILLITTFFITSADSATLVLGIQSTNGSLTPPRTIKFSLGLAQSAVALILLYVGGLTALQNTIITAAFPFSFILILMGVSLVKALNNEIKLMKREK